MARNSMVKASVVVNWPDDQALLAPILARVNRNLEALAHEVLAEARASAAFKNRTGRLRLKMRVRKNPNGSGFIVESKGGNAHLVEFGHAMITKDGRVTRLARVPAHPYLAPALEKVMARAREIMTRG